MSAAAVLRDVKSYMEFWGWRNGGAPGSVKVAYGGDVIAKHGDATWIADVERACDTLKRLADRVTDIKTGDGNA